MKEDEGHNFDVFWGVGGLLPCENELYNAIAGFTEGITARIIFRYTGLFAICASSYLIDTKVY